MSRRSKPLEKLQREKPWACASVSSSDHFQPLFSSLMRSAAFKDMRKGARLLLMCCMTEAGGEASRDNVDPDSGVYDERLFYMNRQLYSDVYDLYNPSNGAGFRRDMEDLIDHGFVEQVVRGQGRGIKNLYRPSSKWRKWSKPEKG